MLRWSVIFLVIAMIAAVFGEEPTQQIRSDLRRLKEILETGEVPRSASGGALRSYQVGS